MDYVKTGLRRINIKPYSKELFDWYKTYGNITEVKTVTFQIPFNDQLTENKKLYIDNESFDMQNFKVTLKSNMFNVFHTV